MTRRKRIPVPARTASASDLFAIARYLTADAQSTAPGMVVVEADIVRTALECASFVAAFPRRFDGSAETTPDGFFEKVDTSSRRVDESLRALNSRGTFEKSPPTTITMFPRDAVIVAAAVRLVASERHQGKVEMPRALILSRSTELRQSAVFENSRGGMVGLDVGMIHLVSVCARKVILDRSRYVVTLSDGVTVTSNDLDIIEDSLAEIDGLGGGGAGGIHVSPMSAAAFSLALRLIAEVGD